MVTILKFGKRRNVSHFWELTHGHWVYMYYKYYVFSHSLRGIILFKRHTIKLIHFLKKIWKGSYAAEKYYAGRSCLTFLFLKFRLPSNDQNYWNRQVWAVLTYPWRNSLIRVYTVCHSICICFGKISSNFRIISLVDCNTVMFLTFQTDRSEQTV